MIFLPAHVVPGTPEYRQAKPLRCMSCSARFGDHERTKYENHVVHCSGQNESSEREMSLRNSLGPVFGGDLVSDVEPWVRANRRALLEGRMKL